MSYKAWILLFLLLLTPSAGWCQIFMYDYKDAQQSPTFQGQRAIDRLSRIADVCIPDLLPGRQQWKIVARYDKDAGRSEFSAFLDRRTGELRIFYPGNFYEWHNDTISMRRLAAWVFIAKLGLDPLQEDQLRGHWLIRAAARKTMQNLNRPFVPFVQEYPITYALASYGIYPGNNLPIDYDPPGTPACLRQMNDEYAELLMEALGKTGLYGKNRLASHLLMSHLQEQSMSLLSELPALSWGADPVGWFKQNMESKLLAFYAPMSAEYFETLYWETTELHWLDKQGKQRKDTLSTLHANLKEIPNIRTTLSRMQEQLWRLSKNTHPYLQGALSPLRNELAAVSRGRSDGKKLVEQEKALLKKVAELMTIEQYTSNAQKRLVQPGARMKHLLQAVRTLRQREDVYPGAKEVLDRWDDYK